MLNYHKVTIDRRLQVFTQEFSEVNCIHKRNAFYTVLQKKLC